MRRRLVRWWRELTQCRHNRLVGQLLNDDLDMYGALMVMQGWPPGQVQDGHYVLTQRGSHTYTFPIDCTDGQHVAAILTLGVINQTPIYGVMGFQVDDVIVGYRDFPLEARLRLQMCPSYKEIARLFETAIIPHLEDIASGRKE